MSLQQQSATDAEVAREERAKAAGRRYRRQQSAFDILIIFLIVQVISVIYGFISPNTFAYNSFANIQTSLGAIPVVTGIPALGVGILMIAGEFDLSVGSNFIFSSILMAQLATNGLSVWLSALIGLVVGTGIGLLNGVITLRLGIPSFITTLGTMLIWQAGTLFVHGASSQPFSPSQGFAALTAGNVGVFPADFIWFVVLAIVFWGLLERNKIGNIAPSTGDVLPLQAIAACVIGGLALNGGRGTILGIVLGSALIYWISDVLLLVGAPGFYITAPVGILIIAAAAIYEILRARRA